MWVVVSMAKSKQAADNITAALSAEGILVKQKPIYKKVDEHKNYFEITRLGSEADAAREIIAEKGR